MLFFKVWLQCSLGSIQNVLLALFTIFKWFICGTLRFFSKLYTNNNNNDEKLASNVKICENITEKKEN